MNYFVGGFVVNFIEKGLNILVDMVFVFYLDVGIIYGDIIIGIFGIFYILVYNGVYVNGVLWYVLCDLCDLV